MKKEKRFNEKATTLFNKKLLYCATGTSELIKEKKKNEEERDY